LQSIAVRRTRRILGRMRRPCVFCGSTSQVSKEHVFRKSFRKHFPDHSLIRLRSESDPSRNRVAKGSNFARTVPCVCAPCNNGWLNRLDEELESCLLGLFRGDEMYLNRAIQRRLGFWATVRAAVRSQYEVEPVQLATAPFARRVFREMRPPEGSHVWLGHTYCPLTLDAIQCWAVQFRTVDGSLRSSLSLMQHTAALGSALFVVVAPTDSSTAWFGPSIGHSFNEVLRDSDFPLTKIWPRARPTTWPNSPLIPHEVVDRDLVPLARRMSEYVLEDVQDDT